MDDNGKPSKKFQMLLFGGAMLDFDAVERQLEEKDRVSKAEREGCQKPSAYVEQFEMMINSVYAFEEHLLTDAEVDMFKRFRDLNYNNRYTLAKLVLRKPNQWHPISALTKYTEEIGEEGLRQAFQQLCEVFSDIHDVKIENTETNLCLKQEETKVIDLTCDSDEEEETKPTSEHSTEPSPNVNVKLEPGPSSWNINAVPGPSRLGTFQCVDEAIGSVLDYSKDLTIDYFCQNEMGMETREILGRLNMDQLRELLKVRKCKPAKMAKSEIISALFYQACTQSTLNFAQTPSKKGKARDDGLRQTVLPSICPSRQGLQKSHPKKTAIEISQQRLREQALKLLGKCIQVHSDFYRLIRRMHIICYRSTEHPTSLLLPALLTTFKKRTYPEYKHARNGYIWVTRDEFLRYEEALLLEAKIDELLEMVEQAAKGGATKTPGPQNRDKFITPGRGRNANIPLQSPRSASSVRVSDTPGSAVQDTGVFDSGVGEDFEEKEPEKDTPAIQKAQILKHVYYNWVRKRWEEAVMIQQEREKDRIPGLERFQPGFVYTRMVCRAAAALGTLKEYEAELGVIEALLSQKLWRRGKRAAWYKRRAVLQVFHLSKGPDGTKDLDILRQAMEGIHQALKDEDTGIVWRPDLVRRLRILEKKLDIPEPERAYVLGEVREVDTVQIAAEEIKHSADSMELDKSFRPIGNCFEDASIKMHFPPVVERLKREEEGNVEVKMEPGAGKRRKGKKTIWKGRNGEELSVEGRALQYYEDLGFKGFHSETSILTTIFALLFWDVIFADVPGAFETPFQTAPLDMGEDTFYYARKGLIEARLVEIKEEGKAREILEKHDEKYRPKETWCIGLKWDICSREDLVEIVECLGGESLAIICRLFCDDYAGRSNGVPDLIVWSTEKRICKFVEVKGPGDTPMENQKLWFDSLLGANAAVEICKVYDSNAPPPTTGKRKRKTLSPSTSKRSKRQPRSNADRKIDAPEEEQDYDQLDELPAPSSRSMKRKRTEQTRQLGDDETQAIPFPSTATPPKLPPRPSQRAIRSPNDESYLETPIPPKKRRVMSP